LDNPHGVIVEVSGGKYYLFEYGLSGKGGMVGVPGTKASFSAPGGGVAPVYINGIDKAEDIYHYTGTSYIGFIRVFSFTASIYCCRIYSRDLTAEEVLHNYEIDKARFGL
jgi:hypothetical protein